MEKEQKPVAEKRPAARYNQQEDVIDLRELFFMLLGNWKLILIAMMVGMVLLGAYHTFLIKPTYQADAELYITSNDSMITLSDLQLSAALTDDYALIIKSRTVLNRVIDKLGLDMTYKQLGELISVTNPDSTHIVEVTVVCDDLELSRDIANALLNVSIAQIYQIVGSSEPTVIDYAEAEAVEDVTPGLAKYLVMGALLGIFFICAILIVRTLMDTTLKTEDDIEKYLHVPVLAAIPYYNVKEH